MADHSYQLYVRRGPMPGEMFVLTLPTLVIGRDPLADILIRDPEVSRNHARLVLSENGYEIQDMGSTNGTFINGTPLRGEPHPLEPGELVTLGSNVVLEYQMIEMADDDPLATMIAPNESAAPDRPLPQATGRLSEGESKPDTAEDFSAFDLFNNDAPVDDDSDRDFDDPTPLDDLLSANIDQPARPSSRPDPPPQTDILSAQSDPEPVPPPPPRKRPSSATPSGGPRQSGQSAPPPPPGPPPEPPKERNTLLTILLIVLIVLIALCCFFLLLVIFFLQDAGLIGLAPAVGVALS